MQPSGRKISHTWNSGPNSFQVVRYVGQILLTWRGQFSIEHHLVTVSYACTTLGRFEKGMIIWTPQQSPIPASSVHNLASSFFLPSTWTANYAILRSRPTAIKNSVYVPPLIQLLLQEVLIQNPTPDLPSPLAQMNFSKVKNLYLLQNWPGSFWFRV